LVADDLLAGVLWKAARKDPKTRSAVVLGAMVARVLVFHRKVWETHARVLTPATPEPVSVFPEHPVGFESRDVDRSVYTATRDVALAVLDHDFIRDQARRLEVTFDWLLASVMEESLGLSVSVAARLDTLPEAATDRIPKRL
jgi:hypothetical protein